MNRRWKAWAILEPDERLYRISMDAPADNDALRKLIEMGWFAVPVEVVEIGGPCQVLAPG